MENSCLKKYKPSSKKWILASRCAGLRRNSALIPANAGLFHYAGNNPVRYIDPTGMSDEDYYKSDWISRIPFQHQKGVQEYVDKRNAQHRENIKYLASTIYGESRGENTETITAVAWSIRNRFDVKGKPIKDLVTQEYQYSCWNKNDKNYEATTNPEAHAEKNNDLDVWQECLTIAKTVLESDKSSDTTNGATHYYDKTLDDDPPFWSKKENEPNVKRVYVENVKNIRFFKGVRF